MMGGFFPFSFFETSVLIKIEDVAQLMSQFYFPVFRKY